MINRKDYYLLADRHPEASPYYLPANARADDIRPRQHELRAQWTGEKRPPKTGEWYLSGAIIEAYRAPNDLETPFHIARIVRGKTETIFTETA